MPITHIRFQSIRLVRGVHTIWSKSQKYIVLFVTTAINGLEGCHANAIIGIRNTISVCNRSRFISQIHRQELRALSFKATYRLSAEKTTWWIPISFTLVLSLIQTHTLITYSRFIWLLTIGMIGLSFCVSKKYFSGDWSYLLGRCDEEWRCVEIGLVGAPFLNQNHRFHQYHYYIMWHYYIEYHITSIRFVTYNHLFKFIWRSIRLTRMLFSILLQYLIRWHLHQQCLIMIKSMVTRK